MQSLVERGEAFASGGGVEADRHPLFAEHHARDVRCGAIARSVSSAKKRSTWEVQEAEVGVKWMGQCGRLANQSRMSLVL
jgi:hypothetical protein